MARPRDEMKAVRAAMLLRCQKAREESRRIDAARADASVVASAERERTARANVRDGETRARDEIAALGEVLRAGTIDRRRLDVLVSAERAALTHVAALVGQAEAAATEVAAVEARRDEVRRALLDERRAMRKRQRLADATAAAWARGRERAEEAEREDAFADIWLPA